MTVIARDEMDSLLSFLFGFAQQELERHGEFYPFAAAVEVSGAPQAVAVDLSEEHPRPDELIEALYEALSHSAAAGEIRAAGVCVDVRVVASGSSEMTDAVRASIEHAESEPVEVFLPYSKKRFAAVSYGEVFANRGAGRVFQT